MMLPTRNAKPGYFTIVAQICNLLYLRIVFCGPAATASVLEAGDTLPIANRRYSRLQICATPSGRGIANVLFHVHQLGVKYSGKSPAQSRCACLVLICGTLVSL